MGRLRVKGLLVLAVVAALHLWLLMLLQGALRSPPARPPSEPAPMILVRALPPPAALRETLPEAPREPAPRPARSAARPAPVQAALPEPAASASAQATAAPETTAAAAPAASAAASAPPGGLLDTEATRRAIREAARRPSTAEMGAQATDAEAPLSGQQRMGQEIARGARGDCLKGEFAGSGMGLLSLPFWLIAEMREKCRR
jgi:type IV secretory pathway VirB10-like protein